MDNSSTLQQDKVSWLLTILSQLVTIFERLGLQKLVKTFLILAIRAYQRYLSPYKGFSCAYRVLHQEQSCSSYFQTCITEQSFDRACVSFQQRLQDCHQANLILQAGVSNRQRQRNKRRRKQNSSCSENNNCPSCSDLTDFSLLFFACDAVDCGDCADFGDCGF